MNTAIVERNPVNHHCLAISSQQWSTAEGPFFVGWMTAKGMGYAAKIDGGFDAQLYINILEGKPMGTCNSQP